MTPRSAVKNNKSSINKSASTNNRSSAQKGSIGGDVYTLSPAASLTSKRGRRVRTTTPVSAYKNNKNNSLQKGSEYDDDPRVEAGDTGEVEVGDTGEVEVGDTGEVEVGDGSMDVLKAAELVSTAINMSYQEG